MQSESIVLEAEIRRLEGLGLDDLRKLCGPMLGAVPVNHGAHLLRRRPDVVFGRDRGRTENRWLTTSGWAYSFRRSGPQRITMAIIMYFGEG